MLIGVNLAQPFDRDTRLSVVVVTVPCAKTLLCRFQNFSVTDMHGPIIVFYNYIGAIRNWMVSIAVDFQLPSNQSTEHT